MVERLDYKSPPYGYQSLYEADLSLMMSFRDDTPVEEVEAKALRGVWAKYKVNNPPPGLRPHPWREVCKSLYIDNPFTHAFVTPIGMAIVGTVGVVREVAYTVAWRWYDLRLWLTNTEACKGRTTWPDILNYSDGHLISIIDNSRT